ncbi:aldose epimerase family protein [Algoriphagus marinus]|uniref:aldose epimerase family protein n=1 Tax=Algoriphagus marinus TaxID=1925762 RepID=UPI00094BA50E|nr:aldose epimerase family protein [Algoriphagus marinus]
MKLFKPINFVAIFMIALAFSCQPKPNNQETQLETEEINLMLKVEKVAQILDQEIFKYTLDNGNMQVEMSNYGGLISRISVPDKNGKLENIALTLDSIPEFLTKPNPFFGATAGRVANRIGGAKFELNGKTYTLAKNNGENTLHGGLEGFNKKVWDSEPYSNDSIIGVKMTYLSVDGEEGFPGNLTTTLWMELTLDDVLRIRFEAETDQPTLVNLTNHTYFNLSGISGPVTDHVFQFNADAYTPVDEELIPTGEVKDVTGTPFDFREPKILGNQIAANNGGFDHNMVMKLEKSPEFIHFVKVIHPTSGRTMDMFSDNVGVQFYTANFLDGFAGAEGKTYDKYWGFCLESQNWPDAINKSNFPSPILNPGEKYKHVIEYKFGVEK